MNNQPESDEECFITQVVPPPKKNYPPYKRARVEYEDFNIEQVAGDGHCIVKCFARRFCKDTDVVLQLLKHEFHSKSKLYLEFTDSSLNDMMKDIGDYIMKKRYNNNTIDLVLEALAMIFECRVFVYEEFPGGKPNGVIGEHFKSEIHILKKTDNFGGLHYDLINKVKEEEQNDEYLDMTGNEERNDERSEREEEEINYECREVEEDEERNDQRCEVADDEERNEVEEERNNELCTDDAET